MEREGELLRLTEELLPEEEREGVILLPPNCTLPRLLLLPRLTSLLLRLMLRSPPMLRLSPMLPPRFSRLKVPRLPLNVRLPPLERTPP